MCIGIFVSQIDVRTAFLNVELDEDVLIMSPRGIAGKFSEFYKLNKAIYGLKQAHLSWHTKLKIYLQLMGFRELPSAPCVFQRSVPPSIRTNLLVYVDDIHFIS